MTKSVTTAAFISSSAKYVKAAVAEANADKNAYLTKAEAATLPQDLQDNFASYRARGTNNGSVSAKAFVESYAAYVAATTLKADSASNGILSRADAKNLPVDLRDNYANFSLGERPAAAELMNSKQRLDAIYNRALPASSKIGELARRMDQELADMNIMSGVVGVASGKLSNKNPSDADFAAWAKALTTDYVTATESEGPSALSTKFVSNSEGVKKAALYLADGFAYDTSNPDNFTDIIQGMPDQEVLGINDLTKALGGPVKNITVEAQVADDNGYDGPNKVGMSVFLNTSTGEFIGFYGREGHI